MNVLINISKCLYIQILFQYQYENKMCWKKCLGKFKHICKLFSCVEVKERSEKSQFLLYLSMAVKNKHISQKLILRSKIPILFNLFLQSLGCQSKVLFELYQKHVSYLPPGGRWIHFLKRYPNPALPEVVM